MSNSSSNKHKKSGARSSRGGSPLRSRPAATKKKKKKTGAAGDARRKKPHLVWRIVRVGVVVGLLGALLGAGAIAALFWHWSRDLPELFTVDDYRPKQVSRIYDRDGNVLAELYEEKRTVVPFDEIPPNMRYAMIASEDSNFFEHKGLDYIGVMRAAWTNVRQGGFSQGASTITQQVVKNLLLTPEKELKRKVQEVLLARRLEEVLTKDEILWIYLNHVYFGHRVYGVEEAARYYFNKHATHLNLNEAATLAGLVQSPERLSPIKHPERALERRNYVLERMYEEGFITEDVFREVVEQPIAVSRVDPPTLGKARHFTEHVRRQLIDEYGEGYLYTAGLEVYTTVDLDLQAEADRALQQGLREFDARHGLYRPIKAKSRKGSDDDLGKLKAGEVYRGEVVAVEAAKGRIELQVGPHRAPLELEPRSRIVPEDKTLDEVFEVGQTWAVVPGELTVSGPKTFRPRPGPEGALVSIDPYTREVVAVAGGYDYAQSSFNRGLQAVRQTGSSFKAFVYSAALEERAITPATVIDDAPKVFHIPGKKKPYSPENYDHKFQGPMTARVALARSRNTIAVDVLERVGIERAVDYGKRIGLQSDLPAVWSLALGAASLTAIETANAYATWASGGLYAEPIYISRIQRHDGEVILEHKAEGRRVLSPEVAWLTTNMLRSVVTDGTARKHLGKWEHYSVGKTGTTNGPKDTWYIGYTAYYVTAVYVGYDEPREMGGKETGGSTALPIWASYMKAVHEDLPRREFEQPPGILEASVDPGTGLLDSGDDAIVEYFLPGTVPTRHHRREEELSETDWTMREIGATWSDPDLQLPGGSEEGELPLDVEHGLGDVRILDDGPPRDEAPDAWGGPADTGEAGDDGESAVRGVGVDELEREERRRPPESDDEASSSDEDARRDAPEADEDEDDAAEAEDAAKARKARREAAKERRRRQRSERIDDAGTLRSRGRDVGDSVLVE